MSAVNSVKWNLYYYFFYKALHSQTFFVCVCWTSWQFAFARLQSFRFFFADVCVYIFLLDCTTPGKLFLQIFNGVDFFQGADLA